MESFRENKFYCGRFQKVHLNRFVCEWSLFVSSRRCLVSNVIDTNCNVRKHTFTGSNLVTHGQLAMSDEITARDLRLYAPGEDFRADSTFAHSDQNLYWAHFG